MCGIVYPVPDDITRTTQVTLTPIYRPLCLHYGYDEAVWTLTEQYLVGTQFLAAPVLYEGATSVDVYFPKLSGTWVHIVSSSMSCV